MNSLTVNLHLLLSAFYRPEGTRRKILIEAHAFPSDEYAVQSCVTSKGGTEDDIVRVEGGTDQLIEAINTTDGLCVVLIGAVQYYSGEWFDASRLARATHAKGAILGLDCAHAASHGKPAQESGQRQLPCQAGGRDWVQPLGAHRQAIRCPAPRRTSQQGSCQDCPLPSEC